MMDNLQGKSELKIPKEAYNNEPVFYCKRCLSLAIRSLEEIDYCDKCGGTDIEESHIQEWESLYKQKYGKTIIK